MRALWCLALLISCYGSPAELNAPDPKPDQVEYGMNGNVHLVYGTWKGSNSPLRQKMCALAPNLGRDWFELDRVQASERYGLGLAALASTIATETRPIETCGAAGELRWLTKARCADGSNPYGGRQRIAHGFRRRAVNYLTTAPPAVAVCHPVYDVYEARCPEGVFAIWMDMDFCGPGENWHELQLSDSYPDESSGGT